MLKKHRLNQNEIKLKNRLVYQENGYIFAREDGHPQLRKVVETRLKKLLKKAEIDKTHYSTLISTYSHFTIIEGAGIRNTTAAWTYRY
jgi:hypothetical protein